MVAVTEASTWAAALAGNSRAFAELFDLHYDRVFRHVVGIADQAADADEVTASAFFELWRRRDRVRVVNGSVLPWLLVTALNLARNHGRGTRRYQALLHRLPRDRDRWDPIASIDDRYEAADRSTAVSLAVARLKPVDAQLIALTVQAELPIADAAAALGIPAGTARVRLHRARARLRAELGPTLFSNPIEETS
jgi:RNA polymerase sigma-70 factor (ECF subfamily)